MTDAGSGVQSVAVRVNGNNYTATVDGGAWSAIVTGALSQDVYDVVATATDLAGLTSGDVTTGELTIDTTAPFAIVDPLTTADTTPEITGMVSDTGGSGLRSIFVSVDGVLYTAMITGENLFWTVTVAEELTNKTTYDVQVRAFDKAGNLGLDASIDELTVDDSGSVTPPAAVDSALWTLYE